MLERLEAERRRASSAALEAQEEERARVARDLHDEVNQSLTGLLLRLEAAREKAPPELAAELAEIRGARQPGDAGAARRSRASCARPRSTTSASRRRSPATSTSSAARAGSRPSFEADGRLLGDLPARRAARRLPGRPGGALERRPATRAPSTSRVALAPRRRRRRAHASPTTGAASPSTRRLAGSGSAGMRERALLVGGDLQVESRPERRHKGSAPRADSETMMTPDDRETDDDEGPDRRRPRDRALGPADAARAARRTSR